MKFKDVTDTKKAHWKWGCAFVLLWPVWVAIEALTVWLFWGWFVVPLGVRAISPAHAMAFGSFVGVYFPVNTRPEPKPDDVVVEPRTVVIKHLSKWAALLFLGWVAHLAIGRGW